MSKPIKRGALMDFLENYSFHCPECNKRIKPGFACKNCKQQVHLKECNFYRVVSIKQGGMNSPANIIMLCKSCSRNVDEIREKVMKEQDKKITNF